MLIDIDINDNIIEFSILSFVINEMAKLEMIIKKGKIITEEIKLIKTA